MHRRTKQAAQCGLLCALAVALLVVGSSLPFATYIAPAAAGLVVMAASAECGPRAALLVYAASSLLGLMLAPDLEIALLYAGLLGYYPLAKAALQKTIKNRAALWLAKTALFLAAVLLVYGLLAFVLLPQAFAAEGSSAVYLAALAVVGSLSFYLYDAMLDVMLRVYLLRIHPHVK